MADSALPFALRAVAIESRTNLLFSFEKMALRKAVRSVAGAGLGVQIAAVSRMTPVIRPTTRRARRPPTFIHRHPRMDALGE